MRVLQKKGLIRLTFLPLYFLSTSSDLLGNLPDGYPDDSLRELFEVYGEVSECDVLKNFGFVHFRKAEDAEKAKDGLASHEIEGKRIRVESSGSGSRGSSKLEAGSKLFVGELGKPTF